MSRLIFNADDFGYSNAVNYGIIDAYLEGILTSTTIMANMPGFEHALALAKGNTGLGIGVHLTLTCGKSLTEGRSLIDRNNNFIKLKEYENGYLLKLEELYVEWKAQIEKVIKSGISISHLDSHHHIHTFNNHYIVYERLAQEYQLPVRNNYNKSYEIKGASYFESQFDYVGMDDGSEEYQENLELYLNSFIKKCLIYESIEVMVHPAYLDNDIYSSSSFALPRIKQVSFLINSSFINELKLNKDIEFISYHNIKE